MAKKNKKHFRRDAEREPARGRKIGERQVSLYELAARHDGTPDEMRAELGRLRAEGLCDYRNLPENPHTKFKVETFAPVEQPRAPAQASSEFARWVETRFGARGKRKAG